MLQDEPLMLVLLLTLQPGVQLFYQVGYFGKIYCWWWGVVRIHDFIIRPHLFVSIVMERKHREEVFKRI